MRVGGVDFFILHTGQHYSQMGKIMIGLEEVLTKEEASYVLGEGDTNSVLGAALVASHLHIPFVHVEAGLRSYNRLMQEEHNRIIADRVADLLFPPTPLSRDILIQEGYERSRIYVTGNTIVLGPRHSWGAPDWERVAKPARGIAPCCLWPLCATP